MSSLQRYKKSGGFIQLLSLIETFGPQKKAKFLEMIDAENPAWARALREKMLTVERIFQWPDQVVLEVFKGLPLKNLALALLGLKEAQKARILAFFSTAERRRFDDIISESPPKAEDLAANMVKVLEMARKLIVAGDLRPEKFDEGLMIAEDIESKLDGQSVQDIASRTMDEFEALTSESPHHDGPSPTLDVAALQRTLAIVAKENRALKEELKNLREKLEQIRKIA